MSGSVLFDDYRDDQTRKDMIDFVSRSRALEPKRALAELRALNHVGLAHVYRDMLQAGGQAHLIDYDPSEYARR